MNHNAREVKKLHRIAMEFADEADLAKLFGEREKFLRLTRKAFEKEKAAADLMADIHVEPSRGVLHRSAATLAWRCGLYNDAEKLIYRALAGNPRSDIEWELKDLLGTVNLAKSGIHLSEGQLQLSLHGNAIGHGKAAVEELSSRTPSIVAMLRISAKSALRKAHDAVAEKLDEIGDIPVFMEGLVAGSCTVNLRLGEATQDALPGFGRFDEALEPFLKNLDLLERDHTDLLQDDLDDPEDYRDFVKAATKLAPDGEKISSVKFQAVVDDLPKIVTLSRSQHQLRTLPLPDIAESSGSLESTDTDISKTGALQIASARETTVVLETDDEGDWIIEGTKDLIVKIVHSYFDKRVTVMGKRMKRERLVKRIQVHRREDIRLAEQTDRREQSNAAIALPLKA
ncbi:MAG: hypothetical protein OXE46_07630 [Chloroflexi bacterium]|nr:hypothetical protein [Chloroflexota bacterium]